MQKNYQGQQETPLQYAGTTDSDCIHTAVRLKKPDICRMLLETFHNENLTETEIDQQRLEFMKQREDGKYSALQQAIHDGSSGNGLIRCVDFPRNCNYAVGHKRSERLPI